MSKAGYNAIVFNFSLIFFVTSLVAHGSEKGAADSTKSNRIMVSKEQVEKLDIRIAKAEPGTVSKVIRAVGDVRMDADRVVHVASQVPGVAMNVHVNPGQRVEQGDVLAVFNSQALVVAKSEYLISVDVTRLKQSYFDREKSLFEKKISSEREYVEAEQALGEARIKERQNRYVLLSLGLTSEEMDQLGSEPEDQLSVYRVLAPSSGVVITRNLTQGEMILEGVSLFTLADVSQLWVDLLVNQDAVSVIQTGFDMTLRLPDGAEIKAVVDAIHPVVDLHTRATVVRAVLDNRRAQIRPGTSIEASIVIPSNQQRAVVVPKDAVQLVFDHETVFVWSNGAFEPREVRTGASDQKNIEILRGIAPGELVAAMNAFHLKAEVIKAAAGDIVSGHGHAH